jgi:CheY-like chemotaxis protein
VIYTSKDLSKREELQLKKYAARIVNKDAQSADRLLDETSLFLHRVVAKMPEAKQEVVRSRRVANDSALAAKPKTSSDENARVTTPATIPSGSGTIGGCKVLLVDDDVRNVFALTSVLETQGVEVTYAENGKACLELLKQAPRVDLILMDVMMPEMDGYETTHAIRQIPGYESLPIIALTAKAMQGDREKCLAAGASDYIPKPVDTERLLNMIRAWLASRDENSAPVSPEA